MARAKKPAPPPPPPPVTDEFRAACHAMVDRYLDAHPGTEAAMFAGDAGIKIECASTPASFSLKRGMIEGLYDIINSDPKGETTFTLAPDEE